MGLSFHVLCGSLIEVIGDIAHMMALATNLTKTKTASQGGGGCF
jgi:hypothetical protein